MKMKIRTHGTRSLHNLCTSTRIYRNSYRTSNTGTRIVRVHQYTESSRLLVSSAGRKLPIHTYIHISLIYYRDINMRVVLVYTSSYIDLNTSLPPFSNLHHFLY